jgi:hypothetical protein
MFYNIYTLNLDHFNPLIAYSPQKSHETTVCKQNAVQV